MLGASRIGCGATRQSTQEHSLDPFTLDESEIARLPPGLALRRALAQRNRRVLTPVLWLYALFFFATLTASFEKAEGSWPLPLLGLLGAVACLLLLRRLLPLRRAAGPTGVALAARFQALLSGVLLAGFLLGCSWLVWADGPPVLLFVFAFLLLLFRLAPLDLLLLHGAVLLLGLGYWWWWNAGELLAAVVGGVVAHAACGGLGVVLFRRYRTHFREQWRRAVTQARERVRVREELALARQVQLSMLPEAMPALPWIDVAAVCLPAAEVGGDYYDFFSADGSLTVAVADVAGHGLASGLVLATVRAGLLLLHDVGEPLAAALPRLNRLVQRAGRRMLVTLALARFDRSARQLTVLTAGHPRLLVRRRDGTMEELGAALPPLGTRLPHEAATVEAAFAPGDRFLLYTDGLVEATDAAGAAYGHDRLLARLAEQPGDGSAADLCATLLADLYRHRGEAPQEDDLTLVALVVR